jgi:hypothetical protein
MGTIAVMAPKVVRCIIPDRINQERRTKLARTVLTAARAYDRSGKPVGQPDRFAAAIIGRRLRATAQELAQIDARDDQDAERIDGGGSLSQGAIDAAWVLNSLLPAEAREAVNEVLGHNIGADAAGCQPCDAYRQAKQTGQGWETLLTITKTTPRIMADVAIALAAAGLLTGSRHTPAVISSEDDF